MKKFILLMALIAVMGISTASQASVWLINGETETDYGASLADAIRAAQSGSIIEIRDSDTYTVNSNWTDFTFNESNVTLRSASGYKATIVDTSGGTNGLFYVNASDLTFENLIIENAINYGSYAFWFGGDKDAYSNYAGKNLTVRNVEFNNMRGIMCAGSGKVTGLSFTDNIINNTDYGLGKSGMNYGAGTTTITGNTFIKNGTMDDKGSDPEAAIWIESNLGNLLIDGNTFSDYNGAYAIYSNKDLSAHPITLGNNDFGTGIGGSGALYELYALAGGGYAVGLQNSTSIVPEPSSLLVVGTSLIGLFGTIRRRK